LSVCRWIGADEELSSSTKSYYKVRSFNKAAAAIEELDFKVHHGDELMKVRPTPPGLSFTDLVIDLVSVL